MIAPRIGNVHSEVVDTRCVGIIAVAPVALIIGAALQFAPGAHAGALYQGTIPLAAAALTVSRARRKHARALRLCHCRTGPPPRCLVKRYSQKARGAALVRSGNRPKSKTPPNRGALCPL